MLFVDFYIPEHDTHIVSFGLAEAKNERLREKGPHVVRLNVGKKNVSVNS
jgi:hypothetical protein